VSTLTRAHLAEMAYALAAVEPGREHVIEYHRRPVGSLKAAWLAALRRAGIIRRLRRSSGTGSPHRF